MNSAIFLKESVGISDANNYGYKYKLDRHEIEIFNKK